MNTASRNSKTAFGGARSSSLGAFTLMELLVVIAIIGILIGLVGAAAFSARQNAYRATATAEINAISSAVKGYWVAFGGWPKGIEGAKGDLGTYTSDGGAKLTKSMLEELRGKNDYDVTFLEIEDDRFSEDNSGAADSFIDPWGNAYRVLIQGSGGSDGGIKRKMVYTTAVTFPMKDAKAD